MSTSKQAPKERHLRKLFAESLRRTMTAQSLTLDGVASDMKVNRATVFRWLAATSLPNHVVMVRLARYLRLSVGAMLGVDDPTDGTVALSSKRRQ